MENTELLQENPHISDPHKLDESFEEFCAYIEDEEGPGELVRALIPPEHQQMVVSLMWSCYLDGTLAEED